MSKEIKLIHKRDIIIGVLDRWNRHYQSYPDNYMLGGRGDRKSVGDARKALKALNLKKCSEADVNAAVGVTGWVSNECDLCGKNYGVTVRIGDEPDYEVRWIDICVKCLEKAVTKIKTAKIKK